MRVFCNVTAMGRERPFGDVSRGWGLVHAGTNEATPGAASLDDNSNMAATPDGLSGTGSPRTRADRVGAGHGRLQGFKPARQGAFDISLAGVRKTRRLGGVCYR